MSLKVRLARGGAKKRPFYRIVVAERTAPRDGKFVERLGFYNPLLEKNHKDRVVVAEDRIKYWISVGAQLTDRVGKLLGEIGLMSVTEFNKTTVIPEKSSQEEGVGAKEQ
ncbi:MAG: 30S ribosomal protein S16 [Holosporales bacterium]|jgi:small subunit ribosomal protein S16|nr:30S ribosomal protein S16 [Holosporales bacterium]